MYAQTQQEALHLEYTGRPERVTAQAWKQQGNEAYDRKSIEGSPLEVIPAVQKLFVDRHRSRYPGKEGAASIELACADELGAELRTSIFEQHGLLMRVPHSTLPKAVGFKPSVTLDSQGS